MTFHVTYVEFHHTISEWFRTFVQVGFAVVDVIELEPSPDVGTPHGQKLHLTRSELQTPIL